MSAPVAAPAGATLLRAGPAMTSIPRALVAPALVNATFRVDYGNIRYAEATSSPPVVLPGGQMVPLAFSIDPSQTQDYLQPPFDGALSFDGTTIHARPGKIGDSLFIEFNLKVVAAVSKGVLRIELNLGPQATFNAGNAVPLTYPAGQAEAVSLLIFVQTLTNFQANGAKLNVYCSVPASLTAEAIILIPHHAQG